MPNPITGISHHPALASARPQEAQQANRYAQTEARFHPFSEYPPDRLENFSVEKAAQFGVAYALKHIRNSPSKDSLLKVARHIEEHRAQLGEIRDKYKNDIQAHFIAYTNEVVQKGIGNCAELSLVAARAIKEFGSPHNVDIAGVEQFMPDGSFADHQFLMIEDKYHNVCFADPFLAMLSKDEKERLLGRNVPTHWPKFDEQNRPNVMNHLYIYTDREQMGGLKLSGELVPFSQHAGHLKAGGYYGIRKDNSAAQVRLVDLVDDAPPEQTFTLASRLFIKH
jgi:hypothetical protein